MPLPNMTDAQQQHIADRIACGGIVVEQPSSWEPFPGAVSVTFQFGGHFPEIIILPDGSHRMCE